MAAPLKRVCHQAARQTPQFCRRQSAVNPSQWRPFSTTNARQATTSSEKNQFVEAFPGNDNANGDKEFEVGDLSSTAHAELAQHRELRSLLRTAAWQMPVLSELAQPENQKVQANAPLRWRYTTYMGELHPASRKVVVEFKPEELSLKAEQREKLLKLVGPRYNPGTRQVKMSCEDFETPAMNKRHLVETLQALLAEAKDKSSDKFDDIPLDLRHYKPKTRRNFPREWLVSEERKLELDAARQKDLLAEGARVEENKLVSGVQSITEARQAALKQAQAEPVMAQAKQALPKGKGRTSQQKR